MKSSRLIFDSLKFYWQTNLAVMIGVMAGTAVISGALIVGDSVRESLKQMSLERLGKVDHALTGPRFFRQELAGELMDDPAFQEQFTLAAPAITMEGSFERELKAEGGSEPETFRAGNLSIYGVEATFWQLLDAGEVTPPTGREVVLNQRAAEQLGLAGKNLSELTGEQKQVRLWIELPSSVPRETLLGNRQETSVSLELTVTAILPDERGAARFATRPDQQLPLLAFVPLDTLQARLGMNSQRIAELRTVIPPRVNTLFVQADSAESGSGPGAVPAAEQLSELLQTRLQPADLGLRVRPYPDYVSLESEQMILENTFARAGQAVAGQQKLRESPVLVYLANELHNTTKNPEDYKKHTGYSMYSVVAGIDLTQTEPFGPLEFTAPAGGLKTIPAGGIVLNDWVAEDLHAEVGDKIELKYHVVGSHGELPEESVTFTVAGIVKLDGTPAADPGLVPFVKGVTDVEDFQDWDNLFPIDESKITSRDEEYWDDHRTVPKVFVSLEDARQLWQSRYGNLTSLRVAPPAGTSAREFAETFGQEVLKQLTPEQTALVFQPVKQQGLAAASGTTDFTGLFIGFSFFLILSAMILIGLLFRLSVERRSRQIGLMSAVGFTSAHMRSLISWEGLLIILAGVGLGSGLAVLYARVMVYGLKTWWIGAIGTRFLFVHVTPQSLITGGLIAAVVAGAAIRLAMRGLRHMATRQLLQGETEALKASAQRDQRGRRAFLIGLSLAGFAGVLLVGALTGLIPATEAFSGFSWQAVIFFLVGVLLLAAGVVLLSAWLDADISPAVNGFGMGGLRRLGQRNASRNRQRSLFTVALIASATFVIVAVASGHRNPAAEAPDKTTGNGGFLLVAESSTPLLADLNTPAGRGEVNIPREELENDPLWQEINVMPFRVQPGENASCLNLYQTTLPTILGVPPQMIERGGFRFVGTDRENPWTLLTGEQEDGTIPVVGDMNSLMYSLHKGVGDTIPVPDAENPQYTLKIVGMLDGSVFQGVLLMSEEHFRQLYPERSGYEYFLVEGPQVPASELPETSRRVSQLLESSLSAYGFDTERVADRLANFLAVQNTYLSTFLTLGGLGLLLGTFGLATVMLRNVLERKAELALLQAVGFQNAGVSALVLWENAFLLACGLLTGAVAALLAMAPHLIGIGADVPWQNVALILVGVFVIGMLAALVAVREAVSLPIVQTLREE